MFAARKSTCRPRKFISSLVWGTLGTGWSVDSTQKIASKASGTTASLVAGNISRSGSDANRYFTCDITVGANVTAGSTACQVGLMLPGTSLTGQNRNILWYPNGSMTVNGSEQTGNSTNSFRYQTGSKLRLSWNPVTNAVVFTIMAALDSGSQTGCSFSITDSLARVPFFNGSTSATSATLEGDPNGNGSSAWG